jgi:hypothetical protein
MFGGTKEISFSQGLSGFRKLMAQLIAIGREVEKSGEN